MPHSKKPEGTTKNDMNQENKKIQQQRKIEPTDPNHLLKEYELCWQGMQHHNARLWTSASIFLPGAILALTWLGARPLKGHDWDQCILVALLATFIFLIMCSYLKLFRVWEFLDRIELYRAQEIEQDLRLWKARYRHYSRESETPPEEDTTRLNSMRETIAERLGVRPGDLKKRRANKHFRRIVKLILVAFIVLVVRAFIITFGWMNLVSVFNTFVHTFFPKGA